MIRLTNYNVIIIIINKVRTVRVMYVIYHINRLTTMIVDLAYLCYLINRAQSILCLVVGLRHGCRKSKHIVTQKKLATTINRLISYLIHTDKTSHNILAIVSSLPPGSTFGNTPANHTMDRIITTENKAYYHM